MKIDKKLDQFIVDCRNNTEAERQQVWDFLIKERKYKKYVYGSGCEHVPIIACKIKEGSCFYYKLSEAIRELPNNPVYTFEQFKEMYLEEEFVLPEKWCIKLKDNYDIINKWGKDYWENITGWGNLNISSEYMICSFKDKICTSANSTNGYIEITFEQFKKSILKQETMEKEIIGYKLIKEYPNSKSLGYFEKYTTGKLSQYPEYWQPVYKEEKTIVKMHSSNKGEFEIEVVGKRAYYRPDNKELTKEFVEEILDWFDDSSNHNYTSRVKLIYSLKIDSLRVGCMEGTRQADWLKVYDLIK